MSEKKLVRSKKLVSKSDVLLARMLENLLLFFI